MQFNGFANCRYIKFIIDEQGKRPYDKVKPLPTYSLDEIESYDGARAIKVPEDVVVVDSDTREEGNIIIRCIQDRNVKCFISKSTKGYHFYFRIPQGVKIPSAADRSIPLGLVDVDYRSGQASSYVIEYRDGHWSEWLDGYAPTEKNGLFSVDPYEDLDEIPYWLLPLKSNIISFRGYRSGDGRNDKLNSLRTKLVCQNNYTQTQVIELFKLINDFVFAEPLPEQELHTVSAFREMDNKNSSERWLDNNKHFHHELLGDYLIKLMYVYKDERRRVWYFNDKFYTSDDYAIRQKIVEVCPELQERQRNEVIQYIRLANISNVEPEKQKSWVCCNNVLLDGLTGNTLGHTPSIFVTNQLNVDYDPSAYDENVDKFLNEILVDKGDVEQRKIFEEFLGYTLFFRENFMKKMLLCIGPNANNGKSTMFKMVKSLLSSDNFSTMHLNEINEKNIHMIPRLVDKVANFDDEAPTSLDDSAVSYLKTIISDGNEITINPKFREPFDTIINAKLWANSNHIIKTPQKGEEWMTRLLVLAFNNVFTGDKVDRFLSAKITTPNAKSYLLNLALAGAKRLIANGKFTDSAESKKWMLQYRVENDNVFNFLAQKHYVYEQFVGKNLLLKSVYNDYKQDCEENFIRPMGITNFGKRFIEYFDGTLQLQIDNNNWVIKEVSENEVRNSL